jgi:hypothetical protein
VAWPDVGATGPDDDDAVTLAGWQSMIKTMIQPRSGMTWSACHQPERPVSCSRRAPSASFGINTPRMMTIPAGAKMISEP